MLKFNVTLSENDMVALIEVINRANEIKCPSLMYYNNLLRLEKRLLEEVSKICKC